LEVFQYLYLQDKKILLSPESNFFAMSDPFWFDKLDFSEKIAFILFVTVSFFVMNFYFNLDVAKKTKLLRQELLKNCSTNNHCKKTVKTNF